MRKKRENFMKIAHFSSLKKTKSVHNKQQISFMKMSDSRNFSYRRADFTFVARSEDESDAQGGKVFLIDETVATVL